MWCLVSTKEVEIFHPNRTVDMPRDAKLTLPENHIVNIIEYDGTNPYRCQDGCKLVEINEVVKIGDPVPSK